MWTAFGLQSSKHNWQMLNFGLQYNIKTLTISISIYLPSRSSFKMAKVLNPSSTQKPILGFPFFLTPLLFSLCNCSLGCLFFPSFASLWCYIFKLPYPLYFSLSGSDMNFWGSIFASTLLVWTLKTAENNKFSLIFLTDMSYSCLTLEFPLLSLT